MQGDDSSVVDGDEDGTTSAVVDDPECCYTMASSSKSSDDGNKPDPETLPQQPTQMKKRSDFVFLSELGEGSFSTVHHVQERKTGREYAAKVCCKRHIIRERKIENIYREKDALIRLSRADGFHPFIVQLFCTFQDKESLYIVMTFAQGGDLLKILKKSGGKLDLNITRFYSSEIVAALDHMHGLKIIHRDLKPENILISGTGHILLSDFGSAKFLDRVEVKKLELPTERKRRSSFVGTAQYVSPEVLNGEPVQQACDYWALGAIIYQLLTGEHAFHDVSEFLIYRRVVRAAYKFPDGFPEVARSLVKNLLVVEVKSRLGSMESGGADAVKRHPFFQGVQWDSITNSEPPQIFALQDQ